MQVQLTVTLSIFVLCINQQKRNIYYYSTTTKTKTKFARRAVSSSTREDSITIINFYKYAVY